MLRFTVRFFSALAVVVMVAAPFSAAPAQAQTTAAANEPYNGHALCLPGAYPQENINCLPLGPSTTMTQMAKLGLTIPQKPLPATHPAVELSKMPINIARINLPKNEPANMYATLDDAAAGVNPVRNIAPGNIRYVSFITTTKVNGKSYVQLSTGEWMRASPAGVTPFNGLIFSRTPTNSFGWIVDTGRARTAPGYQNKEIGDPLAKETVVQIYDVQNANGTDWYMIGPDRWVEWRYIRQVRINTTPPQGVDNNRWIEVNVYDETLSVYENGQLIFATMVASGVEPLYTRPGLFKIREKKPLETMTGAFAADRSDYYYLQDVPWTMYFDDARALHGAYWRAGFGYQGTHGCVNLSIGDSAWLFQWAKQGDWVYVWDPSGKTPTDPKFYTAGGA